MVAVAVDEESLRALAGGRSYERGQEYFEAGHVRTLTVERRSVRATVDGTRRYRVHLVLDRTGLEGICSCPHAAEGAFCKHCVAVALAWLDSASTASDTVDDDPDGPAPQPMADAELHSFLTGQDPDWLTEQLIRAAESYPLLRARLEVAAGRSPEDAYDDEPLRERLTRVIGLDDILDAYDCPGYVRDVHEVLDSVAELLDAGFAHQARRLSEYTLDLFAESADLIEGSIDEVDEVVGRTEQIHLEACLAGEPDPMSLAESLARHARQSDIFRDALPEYAPLLGEAGLARYRDLVRSDPELLVDADETDQ